MENEYEKEMRRKQQNDEEERKTQLHRAIKEEQKQKINNNKRALNDKVRQEVSYAKEEKNQTKELFYHQNNQHIAKANMIKAMIKQQQEEAKLKKKMDVNDKKLRAR